jgi:hypothetical protein
MRDYHVYNQLLLETFSTPELALNALNNLSESVGMPQLWLTPARRGICPAQGCPFRIVLGKRTLNEVVFFWKNDVSTPVHICSQPMGQPVAIPMAQPAANPMAQPLANPVVINLAAAHPPGNYI